MAVDAAGNTQASAVVVGRAVDNTAPQGLDVQTVAAAGGTTGRPEAGDSVRYTFTEPIRPASIRAGGDGSATVVVRIANGNPDVLTVWDASGAVQLPLGTLTSGKRYVQKDTSFTGSSMVLSGSTITVTLGTPNGPTSRDSGTTVLRWVPSTAATDRAGNPLLAGTVLESGTADTDF